MTDKKPTTKSDKQLTKTEARRLAAKRLREKKLAQAKAAKAKAEVASLKAEKLAGKQVGGFVNFIRQQGIIGLAVGLAIGTAAGDTVKKLVEGFINPIVQFLVGSRAGLEKASWTFEAFGRQADFKWGAFVSSFITLMATAFVIYVIIHLLKLDRLDKKKDA